MLLITMLPFSVYSLGNHIVLLASTAMLSITLAVIPFCKVVGWLAAVLALMGFFMGTIDTVANVSMIQLYGMNVAPFLQVSTTALWHIRGSLSSFRSGLWLYDTGLWLLQVSVVALMIQLYGMNQAFFLPTGHCCGCMTRA